MTTRLVRNDMLKAGMVLALPFERTATINATHLGRKYMTLHLHERPPIRVELTGETLIEEEDQ